MLQAVFNTTAVPLVLMNAAAPVAATIARSLDPFGATMHGDAFLVGLPSSTLASYSTIDIPPALEFGAPSYEVPIVAGQLRATVFPSGAGGQSVVVISTVGDAVATDQTTIRNYVRVPIIVNGVEVLPVHTLQLGVFPSITVSVGNSGLTVPYLAPRQVAVSADESSAGSNSYMTLTRRDIAVVYDVGVVAGEDTVRVDATDSCVAVVFNYPDGTWTLIGAGTSNQCIRASATSVQFVNTVIGNDATTTSSAAVPLSVSGGAGTTPVYVPLPGGSAATVTVHSVSGASASARAAVTITYAGTTVVNMTPLVPVAVKPVGPYAVTPVLTGQRAYLPVLDTNVLVAVDGPAAASAGWWGASQAPQVVELPVASVSTVGVTANTPGPHSCAPAPGYASISSSSSSSSTPAGRKHLAVSQPLGPAVGDAATTSITAATAPTRRTSTTAPAGAAQQQYGATLDALIIQQSPSQQVVRIRYKPAGRHYTDTGAADAGCPTCPSS